MSSPTSPRLFIDAGLVFNQPVTLAPEQAHYLLHVMRLKESDEVRLFNGRDGEWRGIVSAASKKALEITPQGQTRGQKGEPDLWLCAAPIKKAHFDYMIEKATELGVSVIQPALTARTQIREVNVDRVRSIAIEAAEQSERLSIPDIKAPMTLAVLAQHWPKDRQLIVCAEYGEALPVSEVLSDLELKAAKKAAILTGPEGGFAPEEFEALRKIPNTHFARLGPRILRADTAAIAALSCWQALCGDWLNS